MAGSTFRQRRRVCTAGVLRQGRRNAGADAQCLKDVFALQVVIGEACRPKEATTWQLLFAGSLALLTVASCLQLGLTSNISLLPQVTPFFQQANQIRCTSWSCIRP